MDIMRALVGVYNLQVHEVSDHAELVGDAVAPEHVARRARRLQRFAAGVSLQDRGNLGGGGPLAFMRPRRRQPCSPRAISVCVSASFFWMSWFAARGRPNCFLSITQVLAL